MRHSIVFSACIFALLVAPTIVGAQNGEARATDTELLPYHQHRDTRNGHDHSYPDRGSIIRDVPKSAVVVNYAGVAYRFDDGVWFEPRGPAFMVAAPPIGLIVSSLPTFSTVIARNGRTFLYSNDTYYLPRPDVGGYEVVNDPADGTADAPALAAAAPVPAASTQVFATPLLESAAAKAAPPDAASVAAVPSAVPAAVPYGVASAPATAGASAAPPAGAAMAGGPTLAAVAAPSAAASDSSADTSKSSKSLIYPKNGQSPEQQARDRYECYRFGVAQSGFDPMHPANGARAGAQADYERAQGVCLDAHGYSVQ